MAVPGFYIARHEWLPKETFKVGHTGDLRARLSHGCYTTCWAGSWQYLRTCETASKDAAARLEAAVLHYYTSARLDGRELVTVPYDDLCSTGARLNDLMKTSGRWKDAPVYTPPPAASRPTRPDATTILTENDRRLVSDSRKTRPLDFLERFRYVPALNVPDVEDTPDDIDECDAIETHDPYADLEIVPREYQEAASRACLAALSETHRTILQMACRCGKTYVSYQVLSNPRYRGQQVLFLVPGLALLRQTAQKMTRYGVNPAEILLVGSGTRSVPCGTRELRMTTDANAITRQLCTKWLTVSTYQSSDLLPDNYGLVIFDEAHRVCGPRNSGCFTHVLLNHTTPDRLYMTATPVMEPSGPDRISMGNKDLFGDFAYRYHLRQGIDAGYINSFDLEFSVSSSTDPVESLPLQISKAVRESPKLLVFCRTIAEACKLCAQVQPLVGPEVQCFAVHSRTEPAQRQLALREFSSECSTGIMFNCRLFQEGVEIPSLTGVFFASPRNSPRDIIQSVCRPLTRIVGKPTSRIYVPVMCDPAEDPGSENNLGRYVTIVPFVQALAEEDPSLFQYLLNPTSTSYPLHLSHDSNINIKMVEKALLRTLRYNGSKTSWLSRSQNIPWSMGFGELKRIVDTFHRYPKTTELWQYGGEEKNFYRWYTWVRKEYKKHVDDTPSDLRRYQVYELRTLPEWDLYGVQGPYPPDKCLDYLEQWLDEHKELDMMCQKCEKLFEDLSKPYIDIRRKSIICDQDVVTLNKLACEDGFPDILSCAQSLIEKPDKTLINRFSRQYNKQCRECKWKTTPPMVDINKGGYVGLDATPMERLSGFLTTINQCDAKKRCSIAPAKLERLKQICEPYGLRYLKHRDEQGVIISNGGMTFIQEAHDRFKKEAKHKSKSIYIRTHFPGYPLKHQHQETLENIRNNITANLPKKKRKKKQRNVVIPEVKDCDNRIIKTQKFDEPTHAPTAQRPPIIPKAIPPPSPESNQAFTGKKKCSIL